MILSSVLPDSSSVTLPPCFSSMTLCRLLPQRSLYIFVLPTQNISLSYSFLVHSLTSFRSSLKVTFSIRPALPPPLPTRHFISFIPTLFSLLSIDHYSIYCVSHLPVFSNRNVNLVKAQDFWSLYFPFVFPEPRTVPRV